MPDDFSISLRPLANGYLRPAEVESQIRDALRLDHDALDKQVHTGAFKPETLVFLYREHISGSLANPIFELLSAAAGPILRRRFHDEVADVEESIQRVLFELLRKIVDGGADFAEVRFGLFVKRLAQNELRHARRQSEREHLTDFVDHGDDDDAPMVGEVADERGLSSVDHAIIAEALAELPEKIRKAFVLHHYFGWKVKSNDARERTLTALFGVSDRQIRNWFAKADELLAKFRGDAK